MAPQLHTTCDKPSQCHHINHITAAVSSMFDAADLLASHRVNDRDVRTVRLCGFVQLQEPPAASCRVQLLQTSEKSWPKITLIRITIIRIRIRIRINIITIIKTIITISPS